MFSVIDVRIKDSSRNAEVDKQLNEPRHWLYKEKLGERRVAGDSYRV